MAATAHAPGGRGGGPAIAAECALHRARAVAGRVAAAALFALSAAAAAAGPLPYDPAADPRAELRRALDGAARDGRPVLVVFGANWCGDCRAFDRALRQADTARWVARSFRVVKVDVGRFDRHLDIAESYGNPIAKGIPAAVLLSPGNEVLQATRAGELADARRMGGKAIRRFLEGMAAKGRDAR